MMPERQDSEPAVEATQLGLDLSASSTVAGGQTLPDAWQQENGPRQFGKYALIRILGEGEMGSVYLARDVELGRDVALKLPKMKDRNSREVLVRFCREAKTAAMLKHPGICLVYEFGEIDGKFFLTMEYIEGYTLAHYVKNSKALVARQVALLTRKLAQALAYAHEHGVIHRDLKPGNVMINNDAQPIVMDFGLARRDDSGDTRLTSTGAFVGTPAYVSPEQITNRPGEVDHRTDIYSLGVMLYEMLAQQLPFQADTALNMMAQVLTGTPASPTEVRSRACPRLSEIAMKAISRDVSERYQTMKELAGELTAYLKGDTQPRANFGLSAWALEAVLDPYADAYLTNAIDAEGIDFLKFELKDYSKKKPPAPQSEARDELAGRKPEQPHQRPAALLGESSTNDPTVSPLARTIHPLFYAMGGIAVMLLIAFGTFLATRTEKGIVRLEILGAPEVVRVSVDGQIISTESLRQGHRIAAGPHAMIVRAEGFQTEAKDFLVSQGKETIVTLNMVLAQPPTP